MAGQTSAFLTLPSEIRKIIYDLVFHANELIKIKAAPVREEEYTSTTDTDSTTWAADLDSWAITSHPLSSQLLRVCSQVYDETTPFLYSYRTFDLTYRESLKLLFHSIGPTQFEHIRHVVTNWDSLEDFSRSLNKEEYQRGTSGLQSIQLASWRIRHLHGTSLQWKSVRSEERMFCQAGLDIVAKHQQIKVVAEEAYHRKTSLLIRDCLRTPPANPRVKWRFITSEADLRLGEVVVDIKGDLESLRTIQEEAKITEFSLPMMDPL